MSLCQCHACEVSYSLCWNNAPVANCVPIARTNRVMRTVNASSRMMRQTCPCNEVYTTDFSHYRIGQSVALYKGGDVGDPMSKTSLISTTLDLVKAIQIKMSSRLFMMYLFAILSTILLVIHPTLAGPISATQKDYALEQINSTASAKFEDLDSNSLLRLFGFIGCNNKDKKAVRQAFADAIQIAAAVAPSEADIDKLDPRMWQNVVWFGKENAFWANITGKLCIIQS